MRCERQTCDEKKQQFIVQTMRERGKANRETMNMCAGVVSDPRLFCGFV